MLGYSLYLGCGRVRWKARKLKLRVILQKNVLHLLQVVFAVFRFDDSRVCIFIVGH